MRHALLLVLSVVAAVLAGLAGGSSAEAVPSGCDTWVGVETPVVVCDPKLLASGFAQHKHAGPGPLIVKLSPALHGGTHKVGQRRGLTQGQGELLYPGNWIEFRQGIKDLSRTSVVLLGISLKKSQWMRLDLTAGQLMAGKKTRRVRIVANAKGELFAVRDDGKRFKFGKGRLGP